MKNKYVVTVYAVGGYEPAMVFVNETPNGAIERAEKALQACGLSMWYCLIEPVGK